MLLLRKTLWKYATGEFGVVKLVHDMTAAAQQSSQQPLPMACKTLRKGVVFKDNTLYAPLKPAVLRGEVEMLRTLCGAHYCLKLCAVYETARVIYLITEYCAGGDLMQWIASQPSDDALRTEDVSRIAFQLYSAIDHCHRHSIVHRDIKPENIMFTDPTMSAAVRLIGASVCFSYCMLCVSLMLFFVYIDCFAFCFGISTAACLASIVCSTLFSHVCALFQFLIVTFSVPLARRGCLRMNFLCTLSLSFARGCRCLIYIRLWKWDHGQETDER
jgi:serine/threonine protein kinase